MSFESSQQEKLIKWNKWTIAVNKMREHYEFSNTKGKKNPYVKKLKQPITIRLDIDAVSYFKSLSAQSGIPYQQLINLYLRDCANHKKELGLTWNDSV